jgi:hypothetical protein
MSIASDRETLEKAKAMGLKLSADGKTWVPNEELIVQLPVKGAKHQTSSIALSISKGLIIVCIIGFLGGLMLLSLFETGLELLCTFILLLLAGGGSGF